MIYLFCSASRPLYKRDALESTCYPPGHLSRFRYEKTYVDPQIWGCPENFEKKDGVIVFLDTIGSQGEKDFDFLPIRRIRTVRLFVEGLAIYIDFKLDEFIDYGLEDDDTRRTALSNFFQKLQNRPWPPPKDSGRNDGTFQGYFVMSNLKDNPEFPTQSTIPHGAWENLIRRLNKTNDLKDSTFFQILGFYEIKRRWPFGSPLEVPIKSQDNSYDSFYTLPMGKNVILKLLFSRPTYNSNVKGSRRVLKLKVETEFFAGVSKDVIYSESRYNEERIVLVCRRVFESILSAVRIEEEVADKNKPSVVLSPEPFLLTRIKVPGYVLGLVILGVFFSTLFVGLDADSIKLLASWIMPSQMSYILKNAQSISTIGKSIAPLSDLGALYYGNIGRSIFTLWVYKYPFSEAVSAYSIAHIAH